MAETIPQTNTRANVEADAEAIAAPIVAAPDVLNAPSSESAPGDALSAVTDCTCSAPTSSTCARLLARLSLRRESRARDAPVSTTVPPSACHMCQVM